MTGFLKFFAAFLGAATIVSAHGAPASDAILRARAEAVEENINMLKACEARLQRREHVEKRLQRRAEFINAHIKMKRDLECKSPININVTAHMLTL
jgi:hypothetical protein